MGYKFLLILPVTFLGQIITLLLAGLLSKGAGLGVILIYPVVLILGIFVQAVIIFLSLKDNLFGRILYTILGVGVSVAMIFVLKFSYRAIHHQDYAQFQKNQEVSGYCMGISQKFEKESGLYQMNSTDPKFKELVQQKTQLIDSCLKEKGYVQGVDVCPYIICLK